MAKTKLYIVIHTKYNCVDTPEIQAQTHVIRSEINLCEIEIERIHYFFYPQTAPDLDNETYEVQEANVLRYKEPEFLWHRIGDYSDYDNSAGCVEGFADELMEMFTEIEETYDLKKLREAGGDGTLFSRCNEYGITDYNLFANENYISLFYGDYDAQPTRPITDKELKAFNKRLLKEKEEK